MMIDDESVFLVFLQRGDDPLTLYGIAQGVGADPRDDRKAVQKVVNELVKSEILIEFDVENDALDGVLIEHEKYGSLDNSDLSYMHIDNFYGLGPKAFEFVDARKAKLMERAADMGLESAIGHLKNLRIDSSSWTGLPVGFAFTNEVQAKVIRLLEEAIRDLDHNNLDNRATAQAKGYLRSALILAEAPDPPADMIAELVRRLKYVAGIAGFLGSVASLFSLFGVTF